MQHHNGEGFGGDMKRVLKRKSKNLLGGHLKRHFVADYHLARLAGLTRSQAFKICRSRYGENA